MKHIMQGEYLYNYDKVRFASHRNAKLREGEEVIAQPYDTNFFSLVYVLEGSLMIYASNKNFILRENECFFLDSNENIPMYAHDADTAFLYTIDFHPELFGKSGTDIKNFADIFRFATNLPPDEHIVFPKNNIFKDSDKHILYLFENIKREYFGREPMYLDIITDNIKAILIEFARSMDILQKIDFHHDIMQKLIDYCILHYDRNITLKELSATFHFSRTHITNMFKKTVGYSFVEYLRQMRIYKSSIMLYRTNMPISKIAHAVGYKKTEYYSKLFKKYTGFSPLQYRRTMRKMNQWYPGLDSFEIQKKEEIYR